MNETTIPSPDVIGPDKLIEASASDRTMLTNLVNLIATTVQPIRAANKGALDSYIITALVTYAGCIHGEMLAMGLTPEVTGEALDKMLRANWKAGKELGKAKIIRTAAAEGVVL